MGSQARTILDSLADAEKNYKFAKVRFTRKYLYLWFGEDGKIQVFFNVEPERDHGVWVYDQKLFDAVFEAGQESSLTVRKPDGTNGKVILFNGIEGVKKVEPHLEKLLMRVADIYKGGSS